MFYLCYTFSMDSENGGLSSAERQRQTAAEIARRRVLAAYGQHQASPSQPATPSGNASSYKQAPIKTSVSEADWKKYHSAWQDYYQKYYSDYYAKAARQYLETEKLKTERAISDDRKLLTGTNLAPELSEDQHTRIQISLRDRIRERAVKHVKHSRRTRHLLPVIAGVIVILTILFMQYNRLFFAPIMAYVSPGNTTVNEITALDPTVTKAPGPDPKLIIPSLNVDVPVHFGISNDNDTVMDAMNHGVAQFSIPGANADPGETGNLVITGHSAGDIYSNNQYKFIFSGLERLKAGDNIYVNYQSVRYTYSVKRLQTIEPSDVAALTADNNKPQLVLVTCTPLGTSRYRLLVFADQINPAPSTISAKPPTTPKKEATKTNAMPANEPSFFEKIWNWLTGK